MAKKRIMFVDDEPAVLGALANLLRRDRHRWDLVFANGGAEAIRELDVGNFDIVITDMRMPHVDGLEVLAAVKQKSPRTIRIILSGYAESALVLEALPLVHQFLSKPCDAKTLRAVIERCGTDSRLPDDRTLIGLVGSMACLPSEPGVLGELRRAALDPEVTIDELIDICERDPALAAKVLQIANTAHFRGDDAMTSSIKIAVAILGTEVMSSLATSEMVSLPTGAVCNAMIGTLQQQAVEAAQRARSMTDPGRADEAYAAGLLHDIGRLVLAHELGEAYLPAVQAAEASGAPLWECEQRLLGVTHQAVGAHLLGIWALPPELVEACERHHDPRALPTPNAALVTATQAAASDPVSSGASRAAS
jgi:HD-like signal output (HDOD) protein/ActR/RegA family two-component response regulator